MPSSGEAAAETRAGAASAVGAGGDTTADAGGDTTAGAGGDTAAGAGGNSSAGTVDNSSAGATGKPAASALDNVAGSVAGTEPACVIASFGRHYWVRMRSGDERLAVTRGKRSDLCVGDEVEVRTLGAEQAVIESLHARTTLLQRSDAWRTRLIAANVERAAVVVAGEPPFSEELLMRMLIAIETAGIEPAIVANKADRTAAHEAVRSRMNVYRALGYAVFESSALTGADATRASLGPWLAGRTTLLLGESGMGKSTLVNALVPDAQMRTNAISQALGTGRHTTTFSRLFDVPAGTAHDARIVDSPGFQTYGLNHLSRSQRLHAMRELAPLIGRCRFNNCMHRDEPGCAIRDAAGRGEIDGLRYRLYVQIEREEA